LRIKLLRVLTDRGSEFCGNPERHERGSAGGQMQELSAGKFHF
jgi:hypothetical protein